MLGRHKNYGRQSAGTWGYNMSRVRIISTFEIVRQMGPLVVRSLAASEPVEDVIDGAREFRFTYEKDSVHSFQSKTAAKEFVATHAGKAVLL